jgi:hypothetical protein
MTTCPKCGSTNIGPIQGWFTSDVFCHDCERYIGPLSAMIPLPPGIRVIRSIMDSTEEMRKRDASRP